MGLSDLAAHNPWRHMAIRSHPSRTRVCRSNAPDAESMQRLFESRTRYPGLRFENVRWHSCYRRNLRIVDRQRAGRVFLAGDSAHVGVEHGMNIGIQEACNLSWK